MEVIYASVRGERFFWINLFLRVWNDAFIKPEECYHKKRYILEEEKHYSQKLLNSKKRNVLRKNNKSYWNFNDICEQAGIDPDNARDKFKYWQAHKPEYYAMIRKLKENRREPDPPEFAYDVTLDDFLQAGDKLL